MKETLCEICGEIVIPIKGENSFCIGYEGKTIDTSFHFSCLKN